MNSFYFLSHKKESCFLGYLATFILSFIHGIWYPGYPARIFPGFSEFLQGIVWNPPRILQDHGRLQRNPEFKNAKNLKAKQGSFCFLTCSYLCHIVDVFHHFIESYDPHGDFWRKKKSFIFIVFQFETFLLISGKNQYFFFGYLHFFKFLLLLWRGTEVACCTNIGDYILTSENYIKDEQINLGFSVCVFQQFTSDRFILFSLHIHILVKW